MALNKEVTLNDKTTASYWKIINCTLYKQTMKLVLALGVFKSKADADVPGSMPLKKMSYNYSVSSDEISGDLIALGYVKIKAANEKLLSGATDC